MGAAPVSGLAPSGLRAVVRFPHRDAARIAQALELGQGGEALPSRVRATRAIRAVNDRTGRRVLFASQGTPGRVADAVDHGNGVELLVAFKGAPHACSVFLGEGVEAA